MLLRALHESVRGHTRLGRLENFTFWHRLSCWPQTRTGGSQATLTDRWPCVIIASASSFHFQPRRARAARWPRWGPEGPFRNLGSLLVGKAVASSMCSCPGSVVCVSRFLSVRCRLVVNLCRNSFTQGVMRDRPHPLASKKKFRLSQQSIRFTRTPGSQAGHTREDAARASHTPGKLHLQSLP